MYTTSVCFAAAALPFRKKKKTLGWTWGDGGGKILEEERDGRTESHQHHRVASPIKRSWWRHTPWKRLNVIFSPPGKEERTTIGSPFFLLYFFLDSPRSNSKRLTGTPTSQPSGKIKSIQENLFGREWEADRFKFFSDITTPKIELRSVAFLLFVYNVTGSLSASRSAEFQMDPAVYFSLMIEDTWEK